MLTKKTFGLKNSPEHFWHILLYGVAGILVGGIMFASFFMYQYIYQTLDNATAVVILSANSGFNTIDLAAFHRAEATLALKQTALIAPATVRTIFDYASSTPVNSTSATAPLKP